MRMLSCWMVAMTCLLYAHAPLVNAQAPAPAAAQTAAPKPPPPPEPAPNAPLYQHKGEQYRIYNFPGTGESIPYRLFVPSKWAPGTRLPMLVTLRAGNTVDGPYRAGNRSEEHTSELQSRLHLVCRLLLEK